FLPLRPPPRSALFPYTTLFRSARRDVRAVHQEVEVRDAQLRDLLAERPAREARLEELGLGLPALGHLGQAAPPVGWAGDVRLQQDRKSTRLNSSHSQISYAVFC